MNQKKFVLPRELFFTVYNDASFQQRTFEAAKHRACGRDGKHRIIRVTISAEDGEEKLRAEFVTAKSIAEEREANRQLLADMYDDLVNGGIEG